MESFSNKSPESAASEEINESSEEVVPIEAAVEAEELTEEPKIDDGEAAESESLESESIDAQLEENLSDTNQQAESNEDELDFSIDSAIDDIDSALDGLELDASDDEEPDWGDAFAESGDKMDGEAQ